MHRWGIYPIVKIVNSEAMTNSNYSITLEILSVKERKKKSFAPDY